MNKPKHKKYDEEEDVKRWEKKHGKVVYVGDAAKVKVPRWLQ